MTGGSFLREGRGRFRQRETWESHHMRTGREWGYAAICQRMPGGIRGQDTFPRKDYGPAAILISEF